MNCQFEKEGGIWSKSDENLKHSLGENRILMYMKGFNRRLSLLSLYTSPPSGTGSDFTRKG